ncbi:MAG TPA: IS200/IS605 family transposase [Nitrospiraceae bacterium]|jgi:putative transposase|nr:IS200/IS605 family transposase [Nitrospiraceae bacterium]
MDYKLDKGCHAVYAIQFHLVMCIKYRRKVLSGKVDMRLKDLTARVAEQFETRLIEQETDRDHIHILFSCKPSLAPSRFINSLKTVTSRLLRKEFPYITKRYLWKGVFWSPSYFLASVGQVTLADIRRYVETQKEK